MIVTSTGAFIRANHYGWHREDGPAIIFSQGSVVWFLNDTEYTFDDWCEKLNKTPKEQAFLALKYL